MKSIILFALFFLANSVFSQFSTFSKKLSFLLIRGQKLSQNVQWDSVGLHIKTLRKTYHFSWDSLQKLSAYYHQYQEQKRKWLLLQIRNHFWSLPKYAGLRIAIDPGHFAGDLSTAKIEGKYLQMTLLDSTQIEFYESLLTWATAKILADSLQKYGATVLLTRSQPHYTAFEKTFEEIYWEYSNNFAKQSKNRYKRFKPLPKNLFFRNIFKKQELEERVRKINAFEPDLTLILHYNVDENNSPWKKTTSHNFAMAFVAGAFEANDLQDSKDVENFIRLLCSNEIEQSTELAEKILQAHEKIAGVPIVPLQNDQKFLQKYCLPTDKKGVYARNLMLCREVKGILCYGESLLQDSEQEIRKLNEKTFKVGDLLTSPRVLEIANAYWHGICDFLW